MGNGAGSWSQSVGVSLRNDKTETPEQFSLFGPDFWRKDFVLVQSVVSNEHLVAHPFLFGMYYGTFL